MKKTIAALLAALLVLSCAALSGCVSPSGIMEYREKDTVFTVEVTGDTGFTADVTLPAGGSARLVFTSPGEASGITALLDGGILKIGGVPVKEEHSGGALSSLLALMSLLPEDVLTVGREEYGGEKAYKCVTEKGSVYISETAKTPLCFATENYTATVSRAAVSRSGAG